MIIEPHRNYFTWKIDNYTALKDADYYSEQFTVEGRRWKLNLESKGGGTGADTFLSLYLMLDDLESLVPKRKVYAKYKLRIRDQINSKHLEKIVEYWFCDPDGCGYGFAKFLALKDLMNTSKGYLVDGGLFIECKIEVISVVKDFSN
ncbi:MATH domain and coiled-coil domain-containing protein At3g58250-like [Corylus avellana]|uniref:MATH domain and coiled-coil domain-containing protein At3g58250-like n=1 Tax=Corylus avellana TaxID=13451 RepID=UPI00286A4272|nr:MATH domain and coiled-coil domain-containing protein At3g58250-like [Corylus avellana]